MIRASAEEKTPARGGGMRARRARDGYRSSRTNGGFQSRTYGIFSRSLPFAFYLVSPPVLFLPWLLSSVWCAR